MKKLILTVALILSAISFVSAQDTPLLMRTPTLNKTHIVFSYAGDLWSVGRDGGEASRLTTGVGREFSPLFSPDGQWIAFTGEYDGNVDVYVMPASGGVPRRLTYHPGPDQLAAWTPDGKSVLFVSSRTAETGRTAQLFTMAIDGVYPTPCRSLWLTKVLTHRTALVWLMCHCRARSMHGNVIVAARPLRFTLLT
jgi:tricorn protease